MKILLLGYYGARNLGDDMMLYCLAKWLQRQEMDITVISECPRDTQDWIQQEGVRVVFTPFQDADERDNDCHRRVLHSMSNSTRAALEERNGNLEQVVTNFSVSRAVLAMRLHAGVTSVATNTPMCFDALRPQDQRVCRKRRRVEPSRGRRFARFRGNQRKDRRVTTRHAGQSGHRIRGNAVDADNIADIVGLPYGSGRCVFCI